MVGGNDTESLRSLIRKLMGGKREGTHSVKEIDESSQVRSPQTGQIVFLFVVAKQGVEVAQEIRRRSVERVETM